MTELKIPQGYKSRLNLYETQTAIGELKRLFEDNLARALNLKRVSAPLFVEPHTGQNDDLSGVERPVEFSIKATEQHVQIVHSLAKWKRMALKKYGFPVGEGIYTDMNAIRRDDVLDNIHSVYVDQWDWEKVIDSGSRSESYLRSTVMSIANAIYNTSEKLKRWFPALDLDLSRSVKFFTAQELENMYPDKTPDEREQICAKEHGVIFVMKIGGAMASGKTHGNRAPDYDDWTLNGDLIYWSNVLNSAIEMSSMGIRVDAAALDRQLTLANCDHRRELTYHKMLLAGKLPLTIGGGIGQSRLSMLLLQKAHIGEVQVSVWDVGTIEGCEADGIELL